MKIKEGYLLREVAGSFVVVPVGNLDFDGMITLNETGALLWKALEDGASEEDLTKAILAEYEIDSETAKRDVALFLEKLRGANVIDG
jgi:hypothetical protein